MAKNEILIIDNTTIEQARRQANAEHRLSIRLLDYWDNIRGTRLFPSETLIDYEAILNLWDSCYLIQVNDLNNRNKVDFTYLGKNIIESYHTNLSEGDMVDLISPKSSRIMQHFQLVIEEKKPVLQSGEFLSRKGNNIKFRQCMLPLGEADDHVEAIFGCVGFKIYT